jgi:superfamily II DNA or RNA helicase
MAFSLQLDEFRNRDSGRAPKIPFEHQLDAFGELNRTFSFDDGPGRGGLLVLPTGAGKTFTTVKWLCDHVLKRNQKILWLAHSILLLEQAFLEFCAYAAWIPEPRQTLNGRLVSGSPAMDSAADIQTSDDLVIMTTQTAIKNLHLNATDIKGNKAVSNFWKFVNESRKTGLFVVLDEAHHAPAYGCRNLLVSQDERTPGIRLLNPHANLLGLTATPTYTNVAKRGWLGKIFEAGIIYKADKTRLTQQRILARPTYISNLPVGNLSFRTISISALYGNTRTCLKTSLKYWQMIACETTISFRSISRKKTNTGKQLFSQTAGFNAFI